MTPTQLAAVSLLAGALISSVINWFFFHKSVDKKLSAYLQSASPVLAGIDDPEVRKALQIQYRNTKIDDLLPLQFVIANEGQKAIRDLIEPLSLTLPKSAKLLEARVIHVEPAGRDVTVQSKELSDGQTLVQIHFKLLNKGEFFFVKLLINGTVDTDKLRFSVSVDDLPPTIIPKSRPFMAPDDEPTTGMGAALLGLLPLAVGIATAFGMIELSQARPELFPFDARFHWFTWTSLAIAIWTAGSLYWLVRSVQLIIGRGFFGPKHHFRLPPPAPTDRRLYLSSGDSEHYRRYFSRTFDENLSIEYRRALMDDLERRLRSKGGDDAEK